MAQMEDQDEFELMMQVQSFQKEIFEMQDRPASSNGNSSWDDLHRELRVLFTAKDDMLNGLHHIKKMVHGEKGEKAPEKTVYLLRSCAEKMNQSMQSVYDRLEVVRAKNTEDNLFLFEQDAISHTFLQIAITMGKDVRETEEILDKGEFIHKKSDYLSDRIKEAMITESLTQAASIFGDVAKNADEIYRYTVRNRLRGGYALNAMSEGLRCNVIVPHPEQEPLIGIYRGRAMGAMLVEKDNRMLIVQSIQAATGLEGYYQSLKGEMVIVGPHGMTLYDQPDAEAAIEKTMADDQKIIADYIQSKTPLPRDGLTVMLMTNHPRKPWKRDVGMVHFPEGSVLNGHPELPFCYRLYREKDKPEHIIMAAAIESGERFSGGVQIYEKDGSSRYESDFVSPVMGASSFHESFEALSFQEAQKAWADFGYGKTADETIFAGSMPTAKDDDHEASMHHGADTAF